MSSIILIMLVRGNAAVAQSRMEPTPEEVGKRMAEARERIAEGCKQVRVSESNVANKDPRKPLGRPTELICREYTDTWMSRYAAWQKEGNATAMLRSIPAQCKDLAERLSGRSVEIAWCSRWEVGPGSMFDLPDEIWAALDISHANGGRDRSVLEHAVKEMIERRLAPDWDRVQAQDHLRSMGFSCEAKADLKTSRCSKNLQETFGWQPQTQPLFVVITRVDVTVRFETDQSPGMRQIEVTTTRVAL